MIGKRALLATAGALTMAVAGSPGAAAAPNVVASIGPVHSLVAGVMAGVGEPHLLVEGGQSPHTYALRPSDAAELQNADVVFWIGPELESFLNTPLQALTRDARVYPLADADGIVLRAYRDDDEGGHDDHDSAHDSHDDAHHDGHHDAEAHDHDHGHDHDHDGADPHIWLSPENAAAMVRQIATGLSAADPANADRYRTNETAVIGRLTALDGALAEDLTPVRNTPYIVFHDAYQYFEAHYGLQSAGTITVSPDRPASAAKLVEIRKTIADAGAVCVFSEPQFQPAIVQTVIEGTDARTGVLDPLGADLAPGPDAYFLLLENLAASLKHCLTPQG